MLWLINLAALFENLTKNCHYVLIMPYIVNLCYAILDFEICHPYLYCKINKLMKILLNSYTVL